MVDEKTSCCWNFRIFCKGPTKIRNIYVQSLKRVPARRGRVSRAPGVAWIPRGEPTRLLFLFVFASFVLCCLLRCYAPPRIVSFLRLAFWQQDNTIGSLSHIGASIDQI